MGDEEGDAMEMRGICEGETAVGERRGDDKDVDHAVRVSGFDSGFRVRDATGADHAEHKSTKQQQPTTCGQEQTHV